MNELFVPIAIVVIKMTQKRAVQKIAAEGIQE
jgi:hypothetical protein